MTTNRSRLGLTLGALAALIVVLVPVAHADSATATAFASVRILGHADQETASGAVAVSAVRDLEISGGRTTTATARISGGRNAAFSVLVPEHVSAARSDGGSVTVRPSVESAAAGRLSARGEGELRLAARTESVSASGTHVGALPVTIAYN